MQRLRWVAEWEKACRNMVLSTSRNTADQSVKSVEKGALRMNLWVRQLRGLCLVGMVLAGIAFCTAVGAVATAGYAAAQSSGAIVVEGNRRVEAETIRSYFRPNPGEHLDSYKIDQALKALYATGLFQDVRINQSGPRLIVTVVENPVINRVAFEGNSKLKDDQLANEVQSKTRGTLSRPTVQADVQRIVEIYRRNGRFDVRVEPKIIELPNNRVDLVFEIKEGDKTGVKKIIFVGNKAYGDQRLKDEIKTSETTWFWPSRFFQSADIYDPDRIEADRDLIRRFYLKHGYADVRVVSAVSVYDPAKKGFIVTFTIDEGARYRFGKVDIQSNVPMVDPRTLYGRLKAGAGDVYNAEAVEKSVENLSIEVARRGYPFAVGPSARRPRPGDPYHQRHVHRGRRPARLHRADQYPRQHPHPRLRDPPRIRRGRGRRLQPRAHRSRRTAPEEPQLFQDRQDHQRAGLGAGSHRAQRRCRGNTDRRVLGLGRLFDRQRLDGRAQRLRAQSARPGPVCQIRRCNTANTRGASSCRSPSRISWGSASASASISTPSKRWRRITFRTTAKPSASARAPDLR